MLKILIVDDEPDILEFMRYNILKENFTVITAANGIEALEKIQENPDLIVLDVMMPLMDGFEVCTRIRQNHRYDHIPIIFLTAKTRESDEVRGLEIGGNDYIHKPISPKKLITRIKANLRRSDLKHVDDYTLPLVIQVGPVTINRIKYIIEIDGHELSFPRKEFELISYLANSPGKVFSRLQILQHIWGSDVKVIERTIDVHVRKIREQLDPYARCIETLKGVGYRFKQY